jgi:nicotinamidase-related amidase
MKWSTFESTDRRVSRARRAGLQESRLASANDKTLRGIRRCLAGALRTKHKGAEFHPALRDDPRITVISKGLGDTDCYSAFDETDLATNFISKTSKK